MEILFPYSKHVIIVWVICQPPKTNYLGLITEFVTSASVISSELESNQSHNLTLSVCPYLPTCPRFFKLKLEVTLLPSLTRTHKNVAQNCWQACALKLHGESKEKETTLGDRKQKADLAYR